MTDVYSTIENEGRLIGSITDSEFTYTSEPVEITSFESTGEREYIDAVNSMQLTLKVQLTGQYRAEDFLSSGKLYVVPNSANLNIRCSKLRKPKKLKETKVHKKPELPKRQINILSGIEV